METRMTAERIEGTASLPVGAPILEVRGLTKYFPIGSSIVPWRRPPQLHALEDASFVLRRGTITALVGESGSGKSTVARVLDRIYKPTSGQILFHGEDVTHRRTRRDLLRYRAQVQMIFQDPFGSLNPVKTVEYHVRRALEIHKIVPKHRVQARIYELLQTVGLVPATDVARKYPHQLSGGQRQRVSIARALAVEPHVILADEPISMLDVSIRLGILNLMLDLKEHEKIAFLYITHDIASARYLADTLLVMYAGQVVEIGETDAVLQRPLHPYTRLLLSAVPNAEVGLALETTELRGEIRAVINPPPRCRFADRCPSVMPACASETPRLMEIEPGHWARCFLYR
jgi:peptide/nickel transport system ATP-binding protein